MTDEAEKARDAVIPFRRVQRVEVSDAPDGANDELVSRTLMVVTSTASVTLIELNAEQGSEFDAEVRKALEPSPFPCCAEMAACENIFYEAESRYENGAIRHEAGWYAGERSEVALSHLRFCPFCGAKLPEGGQ